MAADSKPSRPEQPSPAVAETAAPPTAESAPPAPSNSQPVTVHRFVAKDFILGAPEFDAPALSQNQKLSAEDYLLKPPEFGAPAGRRGYVNWGQLGRPRRRPIPDGIRTAMIAELETFLRKLQATTCRRILRGDGKVKAYVCELAKKASVRVGHTRLLKEIVRPAFRNVRRSSAP